MQEQLNKNDILIYSTHNEGKSVITERFIKTSKSNISKRITANYGKSYLPYLNKLADEQNNTYHHAINKKSIHANYSALTEKTEINSNASKFELNDTVRNGKYKNIFDKG